MDIKITTKEAQNLYLERKEKELLEELFGSDAKYLNFELFKEKTGWNNKAFNPLHQLIELAEFLTENTDGLPEEERAAIYSNVVNNYEAA